MRFDHSDLCKMPLRYALKLATLIHATIRHRALFSALFKASLMESFPWRLSQKQAFESIGQRYWLHPAFTAGGGLIITARKPESRIAARAEAAAEGPRLTLEPRDYVLVQLTTKPDGRTWILHLLNYDHQVPAEDVKVQLDLSDWSRT